MIRMQKTSSADKDYVLVEHGFEYTAKDGTRVSIKPHERYILLKKSTEHWWQVCRDLKSKAFYIPAKYVKVLPPFSRHSRRIFRTASEETMDAPSTEYSYKFLPAGRRIDASLQRFSIAVGSSIHSLCDWEDPMMDHHDTQSMPGSLRTFHNSKKILDPLKRISYMCPSSIQPSMRPSQSLNDLQVIQSDPPIPNPAQPEIQETMEQLSIHKGHKGPEEENPTLQKDVVVEEEEEAFYVNLEAFRTSAERSQHVSWSSVAEDWETHVDQSSGHNFYYNSVTGETTWDSPFDQVEDPPLSPLSPAPTSPASHPSSWEKHLDDSSGQFYFYNPVTGETSWDPPPQEGPNPSGANTMFSPHHSTDRRPPTPEADYPEYSPEEIVDYPEADYDGLYSSEEPGWSCYVKDRQKLYKNMYNSDTWLQSEDSAGKTFFSSPDGSVSQWSLPQVCIDPWPAPFRARSLAGPLPGPLPGRPPSGPAAWPVSSGPAAWPAPSGDPPGQEVICHVSISSQLRPPELQRVINDPNQNNALVAHWPNNGNVSSQKEAVVRGLEKAGVLQKAKIVENGRRLRKSWSTSWTVLEGGILTFFRDTKNLSSNSQKQSLITTPEHTVKLHGASLSWAGKEKSSKKHVMELKTQDGSEYLIHHDSETITADWFTSIIKCIGKDVRIPSDNTSENEAEPPTEFGSTEKLGIKDEKRGQNSDSDRNVRAKLRKFLQRRPTLQSLRDKGYIRDQVFGCPLHQLCEREKRNVPQFVSKAIQAVEKRGLDIDGLYRVSGNLAVIQKLRHKVDHDENFSLEDGKWEDVHVITGALKLFFRELPEPLFPFSHFTDFVETIKLSDLSQKLRRLRELILTLPPPNLETMRVLFQHLCRVIEQRESNRMSVQSVAIVFGPTLLKPPEEGGNIAMFMVFQNRIVEQILDNYKYIFS